MQTEKRLPHGLFSYFSGTSGSGAAECGIGILEILDYPIEACSVLNLVSQLFQFHCNVTELSQLNAHGGRLFFVLLQMSA